MRTLFLSKKHPFFIVFCNFSDFSNVQNFRTFLEKKNLAIRAEKTFSYEILSFDAHSRAKMPPLAMKIPTFFSRNPFFKTNFERFEKIY